MGPKKQPKNGYYFLMRDHKIQEEERGRYMSMAQAADEVKDIWASMNAEQRSYYNRMAEEYKRNKSEEKYNTCGMPFSELERIQLEKEREVSMMNEVIRDTIKHLNKDTTLRTNIFHVIHVNYYCETDRHKFIPAEIAIAKFNLEEGVIDTFHRFVSPSNDGTLPLGYRYIANEHINNTHKTPIEWDRGERDLNKLFNDIRTFVKPEGTTGELPPLYTMPDNQNTNCSEGAVKGVLRQLCENQNLDSDLFRVYRLPKLFHELRNACNPVFVSPSIAETELEKDVFIYTRGIACTFHEEEDVMQFCSLSTVQRWIYLMCDHCCVDLDIELQPGFHCPVKSNIRRKQGSGWGSDKNKSSPRRESPPRQVEIKPYTIIAPGAMSLEAQANVNRSAGCGDAGSDDRGYVGYSDTKSDRSVPKNCWSSVADRSNSSAHLPPSFDENNYPSIGVGRSGSDSSGGSRHNAWSGRGRGSRGRGLTSNFAQLNFNN